MELGEVLALEHIAFVLHEIVFFVFVLYRIYLAEAATWLGCILLNCWVFVGVFFVFYSLWAQ